MAIELDPEQEQIVDAAINAGIIRVPEDVVAAGVDVLRHRLEARRNVSNEVHDTEWARQLHTWVHGHATDSPVLPEEALDRESIYENRGL